MIPEIEIPLAFDGTQWIATIGECSIHASELNQLEERISEAVRQITLYATHPTVIVCLGFDIDSLPPWLRQFHAHYFNYQLTVSMPRSVETTVIPE